MSDWTILREIVGSSLRDVYQGGRIDDRYEPLLNIDRVLAETANKHLAEAVLRNQDEVLHKLKARMKPYVDSANNLKDLKIGNTTRRHVPSVVFDKRGLERYNTLAMLVTCGWKQRSHHTQFCINYRGAVAFVLGRLKYPYALCVELELNRPDSKAYLASREHLASLGESFSAGLANRLLALADDYGLRDRWDEVIELRTPLFRDVSKELFN